MMTPATIRMIISIVVAALLGVAITLFAAHYNSLKSAAAQNESRGVILENTSAGVADGQANAEEQAKVDTAINEARNGFNNRIDEVIRNEPKTAVRSSTAVPDSVRSAYAERRRARERSGCAGAECPADGSASAAAER